MSHLSAIGLPVGSQDEFRELTYRAYKNGRPVESPSGAYVAWSPSPGVQLWVELNAERAIVGCNPHFSGSGSVRVGIAEHYTGYGTPLEGRIYGWVEPVPGYVDIGLYPVVIDIPDWDVSKELLPTGEVAEIQVSAFAHELYCYGSDADFEMSQQQELKWAPESFVLSGGSEIGTADAGPPTPEAIFAGHVQVSELRRNKVTREVFHYLAVKTLGGVYDVVADPAIIHGEPVVGGVVQGSFWLSGRVARDDAEHSSPSPIWARLLKRTGP